MFLHYFALCHKQPVITLIKQQNATQSNGFYINTLARLLTYIYTNGTALGQSRIKSKQISNS